MRRVETWKQQPPETYLLPTYYRFLFTIIIIAKENRVMFISLDNPYLSSIALFYTIHIDDGDGELVNAEAEEVP